MRKKIGMDLSQTNLVVTMAEGNPGALTVLMQMGPFDILSMDDMNIRGCQIWVGYKDHCKQNISDFISKVRARDKDMVQTINKNSGMSEIAVTSGASFKHG